MNLHEAQQIIAKLAPYRGITMQPFNAPLKDFVILPAEQKDFELMMKDMTDNKREFNKAITPYRDNVTVLACSDNLYKTDTTNHCVLEYFLRVNGIDPSNL